MGVIGSRFLTPTNEKGLPVPDEPRPVRVAVCGNPVRLMAPNFVCPYRMRGKRGKNDAADACALCTSSPSSSSRACSCTVPATVMRNNALR